MKSVYIVLMDQCHFADMQKQVAASIDKQGSCEGLTGRRLVGVSDDAPYETPSAFTVSSCPQVINSLSQVSKLGLPRPALGSTGR